MNFFLSTFINIFSFGKNHAGLSWKISLYFELCDEAKTKQTFQKKIQFFLSVKHGVYVTREMQQLDFLNCIIGLREHSKDLFWQIHSLLMQE